MNGQPQKPTPMDALKIALGVGGALAGVGTIVILLIILVKTSVVTPQITGARTDSERYQLLEKARAQDTRLLTTFGWVDKPKGIVRIPVELAMEKYLDEHP